MKNIYVTKSLLPPYEEYCEAIKPLWESHVITNMGHYHTQLKDALKEYLGVQNISLFCNGHMALELTLQALELKGEVITTPFTFISTTHAITRNGLVPVFCDIDRSRYTIDTDKIRDLITEKTSAIIPVHVYGNICNVEEIEKIATEYNLKVIYDAAHAFGIKYKNRPVGDFGNASMFSFHATKVFNTIEGGAVSFADDDLEQKLYYLKNFGIQSQESVEYIGANAKMNEFSAIMGLCNLKQIDTAIKERKRIYERYRQNLCDVGGILFCDENKHQSMNYAYVPVIIGDEYGISRNELFDILEMHGVHTRKYFHPIVTELACYKDKFTSTNTPIAQDVSMRILTLPIEPMLKNSDVDMICDIIRGSKR